MQHIGDKVKVKKDYILDLAKKNFELGKFLANKVGVITELDVTWHWIVKFDDDHIYAFKHYDLEDADLTAEDVKPICIVN